MTRYSYSACVSFGTDGEADYVELDVTVSYNVNAGRSETPPAYDHGGLPAEPAEVDDIRVEKIDGLPVDRWSAETVNAIDDRFASGDFDADMIASANQQERDRLEWAAEARRDY